MTILIVGGDSRLSKVLFDLIRNNDGNVYKTTRKDIISGEQIWLEFSNINSFDIPKDVTVAAVVGGVTDYDSCSINYNYARTINCISIPSLIENLLRRNIYTCYISSNTVFTNPTTLPKEGDTLHPSLDFAYALLKAEAEEKLIRISENLNTVDLLSILRLTKNVSPDTPPFDDWITKIKKNGTIRAFSDLYFSPITFHDSAYVIFTLLTRKMPGIFHLSGIEDISYSDFANQLIEYLGLDERLVTAVKSSDVGVQLTLNHPITALNMDITSSKLNISPVSLTQVFKHFERWVG